MPGDNFLETVEPDREHNGVRLRDCFANGHCHSERAERCRHLSCMGLVLRCKHHWFAAADQMLRQGAARWPTPMMAVVMIRSSR